MAGNPPVLLLSLRLHIDSFDCQHLSFLKSYTTAQHSRLLVPQCCILSCQTIAAMDAPFTCAWSQRSEASGDNSMLCEQDLVHRPRLPPEAGSPRGDGGALCQVAVTYHHQQRGEPSSLAAGTASSAPPPTCAGQSLSVVGSLFHFLRQILQFYICCDNGPMPACLYHQTCSWLTWLVDFNARASPQGTALICCFHPLLQVSSSHAT